MIITPDTICNSLLCSALVTHYLYHLSHVFNIPPNDRYRRQRNLLPHPYLISPIHPHYLLNDITQGGRPHAPPPIQDPNPSPQKFLSQPQVTDWLCTKFTSNQTKIPCRPPTLPIGMIWPNPPPTRNNFLSPPSPPNPVTHDQIHR